ncbi:MAG: 30S ribosome-binding factor RbfA [Bryobacterales bacterium]
MQGHRRERAAEQIRLELSEILEAELDDPRAPSVHVTKVELSKDLANAKVFLSPADPDPIEDERSYLEPIVRASGYIRSQLAERLDMRRTPLLDFRLDRGQMNADRIETLLERVKKRSKRGIDDVLTVFVAVLLCASGARAAEKPSEIERYEASATVMGSELRVALYGERRGALASAAIAAFDEARRIDALISNYKDDSEWSRINREAGSHPVMVSQESFDLIEQCLRYSQASEGAFDISVGPLVKVWGFYKGSGRLPSQREIRSALGEVGYQGIALDPAKRTVRFTRAGMEIDPGGIGKGYAVQKIAEIFHKYHMRSAMISAGSSSMYAIGAPPDEPKGWRTEIRDPSDKGRVIEIHLRDESLSTSGSYEKFFRAEGKTYSHIFDPRTGMPAQGTAQVSVLAESALDTEAWTTALFVNGLAWAEKHVAELPRVLFCPDGEPCRWLGAR